MRGSKLWGNFKKIPENASTRTSHVSGVLNARGPSEGLRHWLLRRYQLFAQSSDCASVAASSLNRIFFFSF